MTDKRETPVDLNQPIAEAFWISSMRAYHSATGSYRSEDLVHLLGKPWQRVDIDLCSDSVAASSAKE